MIGKGKSRNRVFDPREWDKFIENLGSEGERRRVNSKPKKGKEKEGPRIRGSQEEHWNEQCKEFGRKLGLRWEGQLEGSGEKAEEREVNSDRLGENGKQFL